MNKYIYVLFGIIIPLIGTSIGSSFVFFIKKNINNKIEKFLIGFASGVMISASFFSLLIPALELSSNNKIVWLPASIGFSLGFAFLIFINKYTKNSDMLSFSVTLHNVPEGMAVGVAFASFLSGSSISLIEAFVLSIGIAIQNIPEGSIISLPHRMKGYNKRVSFFKGFMSGIVEPIASIITIFLINLVVPLLPYFLSFASGAMIYVVIDELVLELHDEKNSFGIIGVLFGFILMMILDVALS